MTHTIDQSEQPSADELEKSGWRRIYRVIAGLILYAIILLVLEHKLTAMYDAHMAATVLVNLSPIHILMLIYVLTMVNSGVKEVSDARISKAKAKEKKSR